ncbi:unnamed protein product [Amoebophrya sp. A120]|nr:unnamed protein product [Amoebophrya sp. A120]|eukprot:GSA120T00019351001.1
MSIEAINIVEVDDHGGTTLPAAQSISHSFLDNTAVNAATEFLDFVTKNLSRSTASSSTNFLQIANKVHTSTTETTSQEQQAAAGTLENYVALSEKSWPCVWSLDVWLTIAFCVLLFFGLMVFFCWALSKLEPKRALMSNKLLSQNPDFVGQSGLGNDSTINALYNQSQMTVPPAKQSTVRFGGYSTQWITGHSFDTDPSQTGNNTTQLRTDGYAKYEQDLIAGKEKGERNTDFLSPFDTRQPTIARHTNMPVSDVSNTLVAEAKAALGSLAGASAATVNSNTSSRPSIPPLDGNDPRATAQQNASGVSVFTQRSRNGKKNAASNNAGASKNQSTSKSNATTANSSVPSNVRVTKVAYVTHNTEEDVGGASGHTEAFEAAMLRTQMQEQRQKVHNTNYAAKAALIKKSISRIPDFEINPNADDVIVRDSVASSSYQNVLKGSIVANSDNIQSAQFGEVVVSPGGKTIDIRSEGGGNGGVNPDALWTFS